MAAGYNKSMQKKAIPVIGFVTLLTVAVVFVWMGFLGKKTMNIVSQTATSDQQTKTDNQQLENTGQSASAGLQPDEQTVKSAQENKKATTDQSITESSQGSATGKIVSKFISWGFQKSTGRKIDTIIIHSSYDALGDDPYDINGVIAEYKQYGVSAHYLIARDGTIYHLVADQNIAYHAGSSTMPDGRTNVNSFSIGIEMVNTLNGKFTASQYDALNQLLTSLKEQYPIKYVLGHNDIAPGRKTDPWNIDWSKVDK